MYRSLRRRVGGARATAAETLSYLRYRGGYAYPTIYVACPPKTASTWLVHLLAELLPGFRYYYPSQHPTAQNGFSYDVTVAVLGELRRKLAVVRSHTPPTPENTAAMDRAFRRYIVLVRDLRDVIVSVFHHVRSHPRSAFVDLGMTRRLPWTALPWDALGLDDEGCLDELIEHMLPGLASLSLGWYKYQQDRDNILLVRYEDVTRNTLYELERILEFYDLKLPDPVIEAAVAKLTPKQGEYKFRKGVAGNWKNELTPRQQRRCEEIAGAFLERAGYATTTASP